MKTRRTALTLTVAIGAAIVALAIARSSATATIFDDPVGTAELDGYRDMWLAETGVPSPSNPAVLCPTAGSGPVCSATAPNGPLCPRRGVNPRVNAVQIAVAVVRVATVLYAAYKAQAGQPINYPTTYLSVAGQLEGSLDVPARRLQWVQWVNESSPRLNELRRVYQEIPSNQLTLKATYKRLIDPQNELSLDTPWTPPPG